MIEDVNERPINTLQYMIDNAKIPFTVYEDGDRCISSHLPKRLRYKNGSVKVKEKMMVWDEEENKVYCKGVQKVYETLDSCLVFDTDMNCTPEQLAQVRKYLIEMGATVR